MDSFLLCIYVVAATLTLAACGEAVERAPTDEELGRFTSGLDADAKVENDAAISEARRGQIDRAKAAEIRRNNSAKERREQEVQ